MPIRETHSTDTQSQQRYQSFSNNPDDGASNPHTSMVTRNTTVANETPPPSYEDLFPSLQENSQKEEEEEKEQPNTKWCILWCHSKTKNWNYNETPRVENSIRKLRIAIHRSRHWLTVDYFCYLECYCIYRKWTWCKRSIKEQLVSVKWMSWEHNIMWWMYIRLDALKWEKKCNWTPHFQQRFY